MWLLQNTSHFRASYIKRKTSHNHATVSLGKSWYSVYNYCVSPIIWNCVLFITLVPVCHHKPNSVPKILYTETADKMLSLLLLPSPLFFKTHLLYQTGCTIVTKSDHLLYCCFTLLPSSSKYRTIGQQKACFSKSFVPSSLYALQSSVLCTINVHN